ncbi:hypothetical protein [Arthrobacter sp. ISL-30]|uniref:hypothetical protein n=1 Tax=Arthrobacter sp. ISL-30 TaxID=2819109 RepID=UPI001BEB8194|nr:hypothetical protein [Arthrobacter sp. ISL-30]MBT2515705.1 hypothetical protein [Arthrobacter sp. ISL-30]
MTQKKFLNLFLWPVPWQGFRVPRSNVHGVTGVGATWLVLIICDMGTWECLSGLVTPRGGGQDLSGWGSGLWPTHFITADVRLGMRTTGVMTDPTVEAVMNDLMDLAWNAVYDLLSGAGDCSVTLFTIVYSQPVTVLFPGKPLTNNR